MVYKVKFNPDISIILDTGRNRIIMVIPEFVNT